MRDTIKYFKIILKANKEWVIHSNQFLCTESTKWRENQHMKEILHIESSVRVNPIPMNRTLNLKIERKL